MKTKLFLTTALSLCLCAVGTAQTLPAYLPSDGLVGWWPFNGNANDESGNGNNGTVNGATLTEDRFGNSNQSYFFNGDTDYISIPDGGGMLPANLTISSWIKIPSDYSGNQGSGFTRIIRSRFFGYTISFIEPSNSLFFEIYTNSSAGTLIQTNNIVANDDNWHNVIGTFDGTIAKFYFDGILVGQLPTNESSIFYSSDGFVMFGKDGNSSVIGTSHFQGWLDDIAIYNRALTPEEITALYTGEPVNPPTACNPLPSNLQNGLVGYWPFCGNANDESGNGNDGTVNGATLTEDRFGVANAAYSFDGNGNYISIADNNDLLLENTDFSISAWILPISASNGHIFYKGFSSGNSSKYIFAMYNQSLGFHINPPSNIWIVSDSIPLGIWQLATTTKQGNLISFFRNGELYGQQTLNYPIPNTSGVEARIGGAEPNGGGGWNGQLDDIGIWNRALSPEEVQQLYTLNACTFTIYDTITVTETIYDTVSVSVSTTDTLIINTLITAVEPAQENTFLVYPNPASTQITINNGNVAILGGYTMRITNSLGQDVYNQNITQPEVTLDLSSWGGNGLYVLYILDPQQNIVAVKQIVLQ